MRIQTVVRTLYTFDELSDTAKEKARDWYRQHVDEGDWWDATYEDAARIGIKITSFDLDRNRHATGVYIHDAVWTATECLKEHGDVCDTYKISETFQKERDTLVEAAPRDEDGEFEDESALDEALDEMEGAYLKDMVEAYSVMLQKEYEFMYTAEYIDDNILANEYEFTVDGKRA